MKQSYKWEGTIPEATNGLTGVEQTLSDGEIIGASGGKGATTGESWSGMVDEMVSGESIVDAEVAD